MNTPPDAPHDAGTEDLNVTEGPSDTEGVYHFRLYVAGQTPKSMAAIDNLTQLCAAHLPGRHRIEVLDLLKNPELAARDQILAIPTLVRSLPPPLKRLIGTLTDPGKCLVGLQYDRTTP